MATKWDDNEEIQIFREYLRIPSVQPDVDYEPCVEFLERQAKSLDLSVRKYYQGPKHPIVVLTWTGTQPDIPSIILSSHMDVVPVFEEHWTHPPFAADIDNDGKIYARGAQDMKCVGVQYLAAIRALKRDGFKPKRTFHITYTPDEEIGSVLGMKSFATSDDFKNLNAGFSLDEGYASAASSFCAFHAERTIWRVHFKCGGNAGHGSLLLKNTAGEKINYLVQKFMEFRRNEVKRLDNNPELTTADVTTVNLTMLEGGVQSNVIPPLLTVVFDVRLAINVDHKEFEAQMNRWCDEAGGNIEIFYEQKDPFIAPTPIDDSNPFWLAFKSAVDELKIDVKVNVFPGGTDSRFIRKENIPAIGFSPINNTPVLLHDHDEFLSADTYLAGIEIYKKIISHVSNA